MHRFRCAVPTCDNTHENTDKKFLQAPKQEAIRNQWFKVLGVPISTDQNAFICEDHFKVEDKDQGYSEDEDVDSDVESEPPPKCETSKRKIRSPPSPHRETSKRKLLSTPSPFYTSKKKKKYEEDELFSNRHQIDSSSDDESNDPSLAAASPTALSPSSPDPVENPVTTSSVQNESADPREVIVKRERDHDYGVGMINQSGQWKQGLYGSQEDQEIAIKLEPEDLSTLMNSPYLEILDQPEQSYRFRYKRESSKPHGPLKGRSHLQHGPRNSFGPKVKLCNFLGSEAILRVWLFCGDGPSPHQLVTTIPMEDGMGNQLMYEPHAVRVDASNDFTASFDKLNILHVVCGELEYQKRYYHKKVFSLSEVYEPPSKLPPFDQAEMKEEIRRKEKDIACLKIEAFAKTGDNYKKICEVYSEDIRNKKSPKTNDLRILKQSHEEGSCRGNQMVFIFTEKLIKEVYIEFFEEDEFGEVTWSCKASFKESDIHKQVAISFLTPPYRDLHIEKPVPVFFRLVRTTDGAFSFNRTYRYIPANCPCESLVVKSPVLWPRKRECTSPTRRIPVDKATQCALPLNRLSKAARAVHCGAVLHPDTKLRPVASGLQDADLLGTQCTGVKTYSAPHRTPSVPSDSHFKRFQSVPKLVSVSLPLPLVLDKARLAPNMLGTNMLGGSMVPTRIVRKVYRIEGQEVTRVEDTGLILQNPLPTPMSSS